MADGSDSHEAPTSGPIRSDWLHRLNGECQSFIAVAECGTREECSADTARKFLSRIPDPEHIVEETLLRGRLLEIAVRWAKRAHDRAHDGLPVDCRFRSDEALQETLYGTNPTAKAAFEAWATRFFEALWAAHPREAVKRLAELIERQYSAPLNVRRLARDVGMHHVALRRRFKDLFGISIRQYHVQARVRAGVPVLRDPASTTRMAAAAAGYGRSTKNFYRALRTVTGRSPLELRGLTDAEIQALIAVPKSPLRES